MSGPKWYNRIYVNGEQRLQHVVIAEQVLGKPLPRGVVVHHIDKNRKNNRHDNLLICTASYHTLLHQRMRALAACGNANWRKCQFCQRYDDPAKLAIRFKRVCHLACRMAREQGKL